LKEDRSGNTKMLELGSHHVSWVSEGL